MVLAYVVNPIDAELVEADEEHLSLRIKQILASDLPGFFLSFENTKVSKLPTEEALKGCAKEFTLMKNLIGEADPEEAFETLIAPVKSVTWKANKDSLGVTMLEVTITAVCSSTPPHAIQIGLKNPDFDSEDSAVRRAFDRFPTIKDKGYDITALKHNIDVKKLQADRYPPPLVLIERSPTTGAFHVTTVHPCQDFTKKLPVAGVKEPNIVYVCVRRGEEIAAQAG